MLKNSNITQEQIGDINRVNILRMLRDTKQITKSELSSALNLSHTTINTYIQLLIEEGLVEAAGVAESMGGRKPAIVRLIKDARYSFGVNFAPEKVEILLVNLIGEEIERQIFTYRIDDSFDQTLEKLGQKIWQIINFYNITTDKILGVGMSFPGLIDDDQNLIKYAPNLKIKNFSFDKFQEALGLKVYLENEANVAAYAEQLIGSADGKGNIVYVSIAEGIGTGIVIKDFIYKSSSKKAGEFGHIKVADAGLPCKCGRKDCWELYASKPALLRFYCDNLYGEDSMKTCTLDELESAFRKGEEAAVLAVEKYTKFLFLGIGNILLALNPDEVIIGGSLGSFTSEIIKAGVERLHLTKYFYGYENIKIRGSSFKTNASVIGAALLPLEEIYNYQKNSV